MLRRQLLRHWYLSGDRVRLRGIIGFLVQGRIRIRIRVRVEVRVRVYVSFNIRISCRSICRRSICHGTDPPSRAFMKWHQRGQRTADKRHYELFLDEEAWEEYETNVKYSIVDWVQKQQQQVDKEWGCGHGKKHNDDPHPRAPTKWPQGRQCTADKSQQEE